MINEGEPFQPPPVHPPPVWDLDANHKPKAGADFLKALSFLDKNSTWLEQNPNEAKKYFDQLEITNISNEPDVIAQCQRIIGIRERLFPHISAEVADKNWVVYKGATSTQQIPQNILSAQSVFYQAVFSQTFKEKETGTIDITEPGISAKAGELFFSYLKTGQIELTRENILEVYKLALLYEVPALQSQCYTFLNSALDTDSLDAVLSFALVNNLPNLLWRCLIFAGMQHPIILEKFPELEWLSSYIKFSFKKDVREVILTGWHPDILTRLTSLDPRLMFEKISFKSFKHHQITELNLEKFLSLKELDCSPCCDQLRSLKVAKPIGIDCSGCGALVNKDTVDALLQCIPQCKSDELHDLCVAFFKKNSDAISDERVAFLFAHNKPKLAAFLLCYRALDSHLREKINFSKTTSYMSVQEENDLSALRQCLTALKDERIPLRIGLSLSIPKRVDREMWRQLITICSGSSKIIELELGSALLHFLLNGDELTFAAELLQALPQLKELRCQARFDAEHAAACIQALSHCQALTCLHIEDSTGIEHIAPAFENLTNLECLDFERISDLNAEKITTISRHLPSCKNLKEVSFLFTNLGDQGIEALIPFFQGHPNLETLSLRYCKITAVGIEKLAVALSQDGKLRWLSLGGNPMGDAGAKAVASILEHQRNLTDILLYHTQLTEAAAAILTPALERVTYLNLQENSLSSNELFPPNVRGKVII